MDETIETTEMDAMDNIEESEEYTEEGGFPVIPTIVIGALGARLRKTSFPQFHNFYLRN